MRKNKFNARKTQVDGITFHSWAEAQRYKELRLLEMAGDISDLGVQPRYELLPAFDTAQHGRIRNISYTADFFYYEGQMQVVEDVKGKETAVFKLKMKLFLHKYPHIDFRLIPASDYHRR